MSGAAKTRSYVLPNILEANSNYVIVDPKMSVSGFMGYLKGKSSLMIFRKYGNMEFA